MGVEYIVTGKIFATLPPEEKHLWHSHVYEVRSGSLAAPGIPEVVIDDRDRRLNVSSAERRQRRADIPYPAIDPDADAWSRDIVMQLRIEQRAEGTPH